MLLSRSEEGLTVICDVPDPDTWPPLTSIASTVESSEVFLIVISPLSASTFSLKFSTMFVSTATSVALSAGLEDDNVGFVVSDVVKLYVVVSLIPA